MACQLTIRSSNAEFHVECTWQVSDYTNWRSVDIIFKATKSRNSLWPKQDTARLFLHVSPENAQETEITKDAVGCVKAFEFLMGTLFATDDSSGSSTRLVGLVIPRTKGYIVRSDIIPLRLVDCELLESVVSFSEPRQFFFGDAMKDRAPITEFFSASVAGFLVQADIPAQEPRTIFLSLNLELCNRLSFTWLMEQKPLHQILAIVEGGRTKPENGGVAGSIYESAKALGIGMVVLDCPGHWLEDPSYDDWREAFVPVELEPADVDFPHRIVNALRNYGRPVDGIITFCDSYQAAVATAAEQLFLPTSPPQAYEIATNKYRTAVSVGRNVYRGFNADDALAITDEKSLTFPIIVKPCKGWGSEGVFRVENNSELLDAVKLIDSVRHGTEYVVEGYCDGPEVDVNMVLYDGELMFYEISDDYPKSAEGNGPGTLNTFIEMDSVHPSKLPSRERDILRESFHQSLLRLGFRHGVFHVEGRVHNSSMEYVLDSGKVRDLEVRKISRKSESSAWLLDLNPRPPGMTASVAPQTTYGVEYYGLSLLIALRDHERVHALSQPFKQGPQYWCVMVYIPTDFPADRKGIFDSDDICAELKTRRPDLALHISKCLCFVKRGEVVPHPNTGINTWVAYFNVYSRTNRRHALQLARMVREETRFSFL